MNGQKRQCGIACVVSGILFRRSMLAFSLKALYGLITGIAFLTLVSCSGGSRLSEADAYVTPSYKQLKGPKNDTQLSKAQAFVRDSLDVSILYASTLWNEYLTAWLLSYPDADCATWASKVLIERTALQSPDILKPLSRELCLILTNSGEIQAATIVAALPYGIDAKENKEIALRLLTATLLPGAQAPPIAGLPVGKGKYTATILFFYESRCRSCLSIAGKLKERYPALKERGVRVVSISTDSDETLFREYSEHLPWSDKLCDYRGFHSPTMERFGVAATPTLFLLDKEEVVSGQYDTPEEMWGILLNE